MLIILCHIIIVYFYHNAISTLLFINNNVLHHIIIVSFLSLHNTYIIFNSFTPYYHCYFLSQRFFLIIICFIVSHSCYGRNYHFYFILLLVLSQCTLFIATTVILSYRKTFCPLFTWPKSHLRYKVTECVCCMNTRKKGMKRIMWSYVG